MVIVQIFPKKKLIHLFLYKKPYLRTIYIESNLEEDIDLKNQFRIKNLPDPKSIRDATCKIYVDNNFNDPSITKNDKDVDFNDKKIEHIKFVKVNYQPAVDSHITPKTYVDTAIDETSLVRNNQDDFNNFNLTNINSITLNTQAVNDNTKPNVDQFQQENERSRTDVGLDV